MTKDKKQIAFTGTTEYRDWIQDLARAKRMKVQKFLETAVQAYYDGAGTPGKTAAKPTNPRDLVPQNAEEQLSVNALLRFLRDGKSIHHMKPIITQLLAPWMEVPDHKSKPRTRRPA